MSLINKMLQDLDTRNAPTGSVAPGVGASARPVRAVGGFSEAFWRLMAILMLASVGAVGWIFWNLLPRAAVTEAAYQAALSRPRTADAPRAQVAAAPAEPSPASAPAPAAAPAAVSAAAPAPVATPAVAPAPAPGQTATAVSKPAPKQEARGDKGAVAAKAAQRPAPPVPATDVASAPGTMRLDRGLPVPRASARAAAKGEPKLERRESSNPREQADAEYRRGVGFVNQGRIAEGVESMRTALVADPTYDAPRQTLVSLLLESRRYDEAAMLLQQSLEMKADRRYARLLARIQLERGDPSGALSVLQKHAGEPPRDADYQALTAAVLQRLNRHKEAAEAYQSALASQPANGPWLAGLGISLEALGRGTDAMDAYRRARATAALPREVGDYVEQRLRSAPR